MSTRGLSESRACPPTLHACARRPPHAPVAASSYCAREPSPLRRLAQVYPGGIRHVRSDGRLNEWKTPRGRPIAKATANAWVAEAIEKSVSVDLEQKKVFVNLPFTKPPVEFLTKKHHVTQKIFYVPNQMIF